MKEYISPNAVLILLGADLLTSSSDTGEIDDLAVDIFD